METIKTEIKHTICRNAESNDRLGAELAVSVLGEGLLENAAALLLANAPFFLELGLSDKPTTTDCGESKSSSPDDAKEPLL